MSKQFSFTYRDLTISEYFGGFELTHNGNGETVNMSDGVDMFTTRSGKSIMVGTRRFYTAMRAMLRDNYADMLEAYFP